VAIPAPANQLVKRLREKMAQRKNGSEKKWLREKMAQRKNGSEKR
jgi:hypothetical protein